MASRSKNPLPVELSLRMPAEWEPHAGTWLTWPASRDWPGKLEAVRLAYCNLIRALVAFEDVHLIVQNHGVRKSAFAMLEAEGVETRRVRPFVCTTNRTWARDNLPTFVERPSGEVTAVKWRFNGWARYRDHQLDDEAGRRVAKTAASALEPTYETSGKTTRVVLEGGSIDVDGAGTLLTTRRCLLGAPHRRNPGLDQADMERLFATYLGIEKVLWLEDGIAGDDTSGHVDDFARFVSPGTVVVASEPNRKDPNHAPLLDARQALAGMRDAKGRKLEVVELPMPAPVYYRGERLPASYANFYIANEQVLVPTFDDEADYRALGILAELFKGRRVVGIHCRDLVVGLGTLHCSTQQLPAGRAKSRRGTR